MIHCLVYKMSQSSEKAHHKPLFQLIKCKDLLFYFVLCWLTEYLWVLDCGWTKQTI